VAAEKQTDAVKMTAFFAKEEQASLRGNYDFLQSGPLRALIRAAEGP